MRKNPWIYMVYNWDFPVGCYTSAAVAVAAVAYVTRNWERPYPFGSVKVVRYRPSSSVRGCDEQDMTEIVMKTVDKMRKEAAVSK